VRNVQLGVSLWVWGGLSAPQELRLALGSLGEVESPFFWGAFLFIAAAAHEFDL